MKIKNFLFNNLGLKLAALFLALIVWVAVTGKDRPNSERQIEAEVEHFNRAPNIDVISVRPDKVRFTITGRSKELDKVSAKDFKVKINLKGVTEGSRQNYFTEDFMEFPENFKPTEVHPRMIEVIVKEFVTREVPVKIRYIGKKAEGVKKIDFKVVPDHVKIVGYKSQIDSIKEAEAAQPINLSEITESTVINLLLKKDTEISKFDGPDSVDVHVTVETDAEPENDGKKDEQNGKKQ
jgi:YbbR domain-containing protein